MKFSALALSLGLALAAGAASASVVASSLPGDPVNGFDTGVQVLGPGSFSKDWTFTLPTTGELDVNAYQIKFKNAFDLHGTVELFFGTPGHGHAVGSAVNVTQNTDGYQYTHLAAGNYYFQISGVTTGHTGGKYELQAVSAVPEPATYGLMGVGLLGLIAARRRKARTA